MIEKDYIEARCNLSYFKPYCKMVKISNDEELIDFILLGLCRSEGAIDISNIHAYGFGIRDHYEYDYPLEMLEDLLKDMYFDDFFDEDGNNIISYKVMLIKNLIEIKDTLRIGTYPVISSFLTNGILSMHGNSKGYRLADRPFYSMDQVGSVAEVLENHKKFEELVEELALIVTKNS